jgi:hypothetical protein
MSKREALIAERADKFALAWLQGKYSDHVARDLTLSRALAPVLCGVEFLSVVEIIRQAAHFGNAAACDLIERVAHRHAVAQVEIWGA